MTDRAAHQRELARERSRRARARRRALEQVVGVAVDVDDVENLIHRGWLAAMYENDKAQIADAIKAILRSVPPRDTRDAAASRNVPPLEDESRPTPPHGHRRVA